MIEKEMANIYKRLPRAPLASAHSACKGLGGASG